MQHGEFWYAMQDPEGTPTGYARLLLSEADPGSTAVDWRLRLAFPGGTYEEDRSAVHDGAGRTLAAAYRCGDVSIQVERDGRRWAGHREAAGERTAVDVEVEEDALAGMGFVLAAAMPLEEGASRTFHDYNEAQGVVPEGEASFTVAGQERVALPDGEVDAWRIVLRRAEGGELPVWVDDERRIVQVDWGGGNLMVLHPTSTEPLFRPAP